MNGLVPAQRHEPERSQEQLDAIADEISNRLTEPVLIHAQPAPQSASLQKQTHAPLDLLSYLLLALLVHA